MATGVASWSKTASANATADQNVNMAEGMAPSQVNDSCRAIMASVAMWRDDLAGLLTTGTSTAYAVTTNQGFASLTALNGRGLTIIPHTSSGAAPTLSVDGLAAAKIRLQTGVDAAAGVFVQGSPYTVAYNNGPPEFLATQQTAGLPPGLVTGYAGTTAPGGWLLCAGQAANRTQFAALYAVIGTSYGAGLGDGLTFSLPDLRGRVIAGIDTLVNGSLAGRITAAGGTFDGTLLGNSGGVQAAYLAQNQLPNVAPTFTGTAYNNPIQFNNNKVTSSATSSDFQVSLSGSVNANFYSDRQGVNIPTPAGTVSSINGGVTQLGIPYLQPTIILNYLIKT